MRFVRREIAIFLAAIFFAALFVARSANAVGDPQLVWETWTTKHFQLHAHKGLETVARRILDVAEGAHTRLAPALGWEPKQRTQIVLTDDTDFANGSATSLPYNTVRLFVTAPDDLSPLADYDDWQIELVTHEYTHILHTDNITGLPAIYNAIFGKTYSPNQMQPRWLLEGLAVLQETYFTSGGRNRSTTFDMYLRADVLEDNVAPIDQVSHSPRRWPQGNLWYLYGSHFLEYIQDIYGPEALRSVASDYGSQIIPYGINRSIHRATGKTYVELYEGWIGWMKERYAAQKEKVITKGRQEGKRITFGGQEVYHPRYVPFEIAKLHPDWGTRPVVFYRNDGHTPTGLYVLDAQNPENTRLITRTSGDSTPSFMPDGTLVYDSVDVYKHVYFFWDLFQRAPDDQDGDEWDQGLRLTEGLRASEPDVSPDGSRVVFTVDKAGTRSLFVASIVNSNGASFDQLHELVDSKRYEQVYTPRWSPDGKSVAYSRWTEGGYRDVVIVDVATGLITEVTHDRALDTGPAWSSDGKHLFFSSDRTGIPNIYRYTLATGVLVQVTNVVNGAFQPMPSADGKKLVYVGYTHLGYDLFEMNLDEKKFLDAEPYVDTRGPRPPEPNHLDVTPTPYDPWPTLRPYTWSFTFRPDAFGNAVVVTTQGGDVVGHHAFSLSIASSFERGEPSVDFQYLYRRLPFDMRGHLYRFIAPRGGYRFNGQTPTWIEQTIGADTGINVPIVQGFNSQNLALTYSFARFAAEDGFPKSGFDPYSTPNVFPPTGFIGAVHLGYSWSNVQSFLWSVGAEKGYALSVGLDYARKELASDFDLLVAGYNAAAYIPMPWLRHHVLAFHAQGGATAGDYSKRGAFALGGYTEIPLPDAIRNLLIQPGVALRGYPPGAAVGDAYQLFDLEYRFPILNVDRGVQTLPAFLERIYGNVFFDYGNATFEHLDMLHFKTGVGFELFTDFVLGYFEALTLKVGAAYGLSDGGIRPHSGEGLGSYFGQTYVVLSQLF